MNSLLKFIPVLFGLLFAVFVQPSLAQEPNQPLRFERFTVENGLSSSEVMFALQDADGYMWFGTLDGLNRFDGYEVTVYRNDIEDPTSLSSNLVMAGVEAADGSLWFGTDSGGVNRFDKATGQFTRYQHDLDNPNTISHNSVWAVTQDHTGLIWVGSRAGLNSINPDTGEIKRYLADPDNPSALNHGFITMLYEDSRGNLWVATFEGLHRFNRDTNDFTRYLPDPDNPHSISIEKTWGVHEDSRGNLWVATRGGGGLNRMDPTGQFTVYKHDPNDPHSISDDNVWSIYEDSRGILWIGTQDGGLNRFDPDTEQFTSYQNNPYDPFSLAGNDVFRVYEDDSGAIWVVDRKQGLSKFYPALQRFSLYNATANPPLTLSNNSLYGIYVDTEGVLWLATQDGLNKIDRANQTAAIYRHNPDDPNSIPGNAIYIISADTDGSLWLGMQGKGLVHFNPETEIFTTYQDDRENDNDLPTNYITAVIPNADGTLWVGTLGFGLLRYSPQTNTAVTYKHDPDDPNSLSEDTIYILQRDSQGNLWIGTARGGLSIFNPATERFTNYLPDPDDLTAISDPSVNAIYLADDNTAWLGTLGGLNQFDRKSGVFTTCRTKDGLPNDSIFGVLPNGDDLWLSTGQGVSQFNTQAKTFRNFDYTDGLQSNKFNLFSFYRGNTGELFFGGPNGLNAFRPEAITLNTYAPRVVLTGFNLFNQPVPVGSDLLPHPIDRTEHITLNYNQSVIGFTFAGLNYQLTQKNLYSYKLEGFDQDWSPPSDKREVTYTNLDPGTYTFLVKAANNDGVWNDTPFLLKLTILPPWWETVWFRVLSVLGVIGLLVGGIYWRTRSVELYSRHLEAEVSARTLELQESENRFAAVMNSVGALIYVADMDTHEVLFINEYTRKLFGDVIGKDSRQVIPTGPDAFSQSDINKQLAANGIPTGSYACDFQDTLNDRWYNTNQQAIYWTDGRLVRLEVAIDITERIQMERQIVKHERMASVGQMAAGIAHEFNNILTGIFGFTQLLQRSPDTPVSMQSGLRRISTSSERAAYLVRQILDFSQKTVRQPQQIDLAAFVPETIDFLKATISENIQMTLNIDPGTYLMKADQTQLQQAIANLALNAKDAMPAGGELQIRLSQVECKGDIFDALYNKPIVGELIRLQMTDTGEGIAPDIKARIFEPFFTTREIGEGSGLGLSQVAGIVSQHQGYIAVDSRKGQGATFTLYLPPLKDVDLDTMQASRVKPVKMGDKHGQTILLAEDEPVVQETITAMLKFLGYKVLVASNGEEAIKLFKAHVQEIVLILSDMVMPDVDGEVLFHRLKAETNHLKMIVMSGYPLGDKGAKLLEQGVIDWFKKPISIDQLAQVVENALSDKTAS